jgi:mannose-6-phosphate isomerase-like protein (cupin superfamily)
MQVHIDNVTPNEIVPGVLERELLSFNQSATKELRVSHYTITNGEIIFEGDKIEYQHYIISGCGYWYRKLHSGLASDTAMRKLGALLHSDTAIFVPSNKNPHSIMNVGESPLIVLTHAYKLPTPNFRLAKSATSQLYKARVNIHADMVHQPLFTEVEHVLLGARRAHAVDMQTHAPLGTIPVHTNPEETLYFLRGWGEALSEDVRFKVRPGSFVYTPEGATMGIFNTNETYPLQYLCMEFTEQDKGWSDRGYQGKV